MKKIICKLLIIPIMFGVICFIKPALIFADADGNDSEIVMEVNSKRVLHEKNAREKRYMASTTKILTAIVIIENCDLSDIVTVTSETVGVEGSSIYLEAGERISVKDLLYGLMLRSGNDCAETLAVYCSESIDAFADLMNETARRIGATESHFTNPHGLHDDEHYTTAYDLALISCYAIQNEIFKEIVSTKSVNISHSTRDYDRHITNKNKMLDEFSGATGIKTGYTKKAGRCLVTSCERDGTELVSVVLNCPPMFERSKELLSECFSEYKNYKIYESDNIIAFAKTENSKEKCGLCVREDIILPLNKYERENLKIVFDYPEVIKKGTKKDECIGFVKIYCLNNLLFTKKIYTIIDIP